MVAFTPQLEDFPYNLDTPYTVDEWLEICQLCDDIVAQFVADEEGEEGN